MARGKKRKAFTGKNMTVVIRANVRKQEKGRPCEARGEVAGTPGKAKLGSKRSFLKTLNKYRTSNNFVHTSTIDPGASIGQSRHVSPWSQQKRFDYKTRVLRVSHR